MKHFAVKEELFQKVMNHLEEKKIKVFIGAWVEKACEDFIDFELLEQQRILIRRRKIEREGKV
jgi:NADH dehydrogenase FAD-containing subunit